MANNYAANVYEIEGPVGGVRAHEAAIAVAEGRGVTTAALRADYLGMLVDVGRLEEVVEAGERVHAECLAQGFTTRAISAVASTARALWETGDTGHALTLATATRGQLGGEGYQPAIVESAAGELLGVFIGAGRRDEARSLLEQVAADGRISWDASQRLPAFVRAAVALGDIDLATRLCGRASPHWPLFEAGVAAARACVTEAQGDPALAAGRYAEAAERWRRSAPGSRRATPSSGADAPSRCWATPGRRRRCTRRSASSRRWAHTPASRSATSCSPA
jgi:hypothetical protein